MIIPILKGVCSLLWHLPCYVAYWFYSWRGGIVAVDARLRCARFGDDVETERMQSAYMWSDDAGVLGAIKE